jgi:hypothetical protein
VSVSRLAALPAEAVEAASRGIDLVLVMLAVRDVIFVHVGHEQRTVRGVGAVKRTEAHVLGPHRDPEVVRHVGRALRDALEVGDGVVEAIKGEQVRPGEAIAVPSMKEPKWAKRGTFVRVPRMKPEGRVARRAELARVDALLEVDAALDVMPAAGVAAVVAGIIRRRRGTPGRRDCPSLR